MRSAMHKRDPARVFLRRLALVALVLAVIFIAPGVWGVYQKERESRALRVQAERERDDLLQREERLEEDIATLKTDRGVEEVLRSQYALAEEGEGLIVLVEPSAPSVSVATTTSPQWFQRLFFWR